MFELNIKFNHEQRNIAELYKYVPPKTKLKGTKIAIIHNRKIQYISILRKLKKKLTNKPEKITATNSDRKPHQTNFTK